MLNFIVLLSFFSFLNPSYYFGTESTPMKTKMGGKANYASAKMLEEKYHLWPCGTGMRVNDQVEGLYLSFQYYEPIADINEARTLLMNVVKDHLANILSYTEAKPYLIDPFTLENITVTIFFRKKDGSYCFHPEFARASFYRNKAVFATDDEHILGKQPVYIREPLQYAMDIVEGRIEPPVYPELQN